MASVDDMVAGNGRNSGAGNAVAAKAGKKVGKTVLKIFLTVFAPIIIVLFFALVIILIIAYWINQIVSTAEAVAKAFDNYTYYLSGEVLGDLGDDDACRYFRIKEADSVWDLSASDVVAAISNSFASLDMTDSFYSEDDFLRILNCAADYETDESLSGVFYNSSYTRTYTVDELFFIYLDAYETLCVEGKMPGGDYETIYMLEDEVVSEYGDDFDSWDWVYEDSDEELYDALCKLDDIVNEWIDKDLISFSKLDESRNPNLESHAQLNRPYSYDLSYLVYPYTFSFKGSRVYYPTTGVYEYRADDIPFMLEFVTQMEDWFTEYGELVHYDPVLEALWYETGMADTEDTDGFYGLSYYDTDSGGSDTMEYDSYYCDYVKCDLDLTFYDYYMENRLVDVVRMTALWSARGYVTYDDIYCENTTLSADILMGWIGAGITQGGATSSDRETNIGYIMDSNSSYISQGNMLGRMFTNFALHVYNPDVISYGGFAEVYKLSEYGAEGEETSETYANVADDDTELWDDNEVTYKQEVTVALSSNYTNLSYYDIEKEFGVTWKLLLALCMTHDMERMEYEFGEDNIDGYLILDTTFMENCASIIFNTSSYSVDVLNVDYGGENIGCIENNSIAYQEDLILQIMSETGSMEGELTLTDRRGEPLSVDAVRALTHYSSADSNDIFYSVGKGYYSTTELTPSYAISYYSSLVADIIVEDANNNNVIETDEVEIVYHPDELYDAVAGLIDGGFDNDILNMVVLALSASSDITDGGEDIGITDEISRYETYETGEHQPEADCLSHDIYLSDSTLLVKETTSATVEPNADSTINTEGVYLANTYFYNESQYAVDMIMEYGLRGDADTEAEVWNNLTSAYYLESEVGSILEQLSEYTGESTSAIQSKLFMNSVNSTAIIKYTPSDALRFRELTDGEIEAIMSDLNFPSTAGDSITGSMETVIRTALHSVGKIEYQNTGSGVNNTIQNWEKDAEPLTTRINSYGWLDYNTYPRNVGDYKYFAYSASDGNSYYFSSDCTKFVSWLYFMAGNGVFSNNSDATSATYVTTSYYINTTAADVVNANYKQEYNPMSLVGVYTGENGPDLSELEPGDIIVSSGSKGSSTGHATIFISAVSSKSYMSVECNGVLESYGTITYTGETTYPSQWEQRGGTLYMQRDIDMSKHDYFVYRISVPDSRTAYLD